MAERENGEPGMSEAADRFRPVEVDPERRRMMAELAAWHTEWAAKWGIDDYPYDGLGIEEWEARIPPEAEADYRRRADEIMGIDPATGLRREPAAGRPDTAAGTPEAVAGRPETAAGTPEAAAGRPDADGGRPDGGGAGDGRPPLARTQDEAVLYMDLHRCPRCGAQQTRWEPGALVDAGGALARRYTGDCGSCGEHREFVFRVPDTIPARPAGARVHYGGDTPSELIDPGQWLGMSDPYAEEAHAARERGDAALARSHAELAAAFVGEALKFVPAGAPAVPEAAIWSTAGRRIYAAGPERFTRRRLLLLLGMLREEFGLPDAAQPGPGGAGEVAGPPRLPFARTSAELRLFLDLRPCVCGAVRAAWTHRVRDLDDGLVAEYTARCPDCDRERLFTFLLPDEPLGSGPEGAAFRYGDERPSELLDPGEWLSAADQLSRSVPMLADGAGPQERHRFRFAIGRAAAALAEVMRFAPPGAAAVPESACFTDRGRAVYRAEPGRFRLDRLAAVRESYLRLLELAER